MHTSEAPSEPQLLYLPDTLQNWPWPRAINPFYEEVNVESSAWLKTFKPFNERSQYTFDLCNLGLLAALSYPSISKENLRTGLDLLNLFFLVDEFTDNQPQPVVEQIINVVIDALNNPQKSRPRRDNPRRDRKTVSQRTIVHNDTSIHMTSNSTWIRGEKTATAQAAKHFMESSTDYLRSVIVQAACRDGGMIHTVEEYFEARRQNSGVRPSFTAGELHLSIPDCVFYHPIIKRLEYHIVDLIILNNDMTSYNREQATDDDLYNILTVVMRQFSLSLPDAVAWASEYHEEIEAKFFDDLKNVPSWGEDIDSQVAMYIENIARWPRGNDCWSFEGARYHGSKGLEVQKTRCVPLLPKRKMNTHPHGDIDVPIVDFL